MLRKSKKAVLFALMAAVLFMMPAAPVTVASAASGDGVEATITSENTVKLACVFDAILTMIQTIGTCEDADNEDLCYIDSVITMVLSTMACVALDAQMTCVFNIVLTAIDDIVLCEDIGCALSTVFSMIIDVINCIETIPATTA